MRSFIIGHDCGHGSFFKSRKANRFVGFFATMLTFLPSYHWSHEHARHHAAAGDLDRRGHGDIWTATVEEYLAMPLWKRIWYRLYRNPVFLLGVGPLYVFLLHYRVWRSGANQRVRMSTLQTNLALAVIITAASLTIGFKAYVMIQLPVMILAGAAGIWLFYVQHQFENTYWSRHEDWDYVQSALEGASFYKLPRVLQWFTGNIGFHHIHHLSPRIPNYRLQKCHEASPLFRQVKPLSLRASLKSLSFRLYDEEHRKMVGFGDLKRSPLRGA